MATLQIRNASYRVLFCYAGHRYTFTLGKVSEREAANAAAGVDQILLRLEQKLLRLPEGADVVEFIKNGGKLEEPKAAPPSTVTLATFRQKYLDTHRNGAMEDNSLATVAMHLNHFARTLGESFHLQQLTLADLQRHVTERSQKKYRGKQLSPVTLKKEVASFRAAWNWATLTGFVKGPFPSKGLVYPKADEKPPFMTRQEIERKLVGGLTEAEVAELWDSLYLRKEEIQQFLEHVKDYAAHAWVYPLVSTAAHTGARRSELLRMQVGDINFDADTILVREKKRSRKQRTTRYVAMTPFLKTVLRGWLTEHPGGKYLFCQSEQVSRSKKRSCTTGHRGEVTRTKSHKERMASVRLRERPGVLPVTRDEAHDHFRRTRAGSKWEVLRGIHVLRHSFVSCLAAGGVDQRIIDEFVGHQTDEQRRRYRHLVPDVKQKAIAGVFG